MEPIAVDESSDIIEFFEYCINSILYQRGIYPSNDFQFEQNYGMQLLVTNNDEVKAYVDGFMAQTRVWHQENKLRKLNVVIKSKATGETLERWQFDIASTAQENGDQSFVQETTSEVKAQIRKIMRQIFASVTFLPELDRNDVTFMIQAHTDRDVEVPAAWNDGVPQLIPGGGEHVRLAPLTTSTHTVLPIIAYRTTDNDM